MEKKVVVLTAPSYNKSCIEVGMGRTGPVHGLRPRAWVNGGPGRARALEWRAGPGSVL